MAEATNPRVFNKYEVIRRLAVGGMGEIFLARQVGVAGFERLVILKSLLPQLAEDTDMLGQFLDEARIVGNINHPNVVACFEVGEWEGVYFIAMEYVNGVDLAALQRASDDAGQRFPVNVALTLVREASLGLDSAHHAGDANGRPLKIVHRDISPHNIMVRSDGLTKVVDFGVAMATNRQKRTEGGLLKGKLGYMAPEQIKGQPIDARADQFSLGVLMWELLAGRRLFVGDSPEAVFMKIVRETVPPPSSVMADITPEVDAVVAKMTAQDPGERYGRLAEAAAALRRVLDHRGAMEGEAADLVGQLVGAQLSERVRDLSPSPVRILGIGAAATDPVQMSMSMCGNCGAQAVRGDRFCRSCGANLTGQRKRETPSPVPPLTAPTGRGSAAPVGAFAEVEDDLIDVALDDSSGPRETAVVSALVELVDAAGAHSPKDAMVKPLWSALDEVASRYGGAISTTGNKLTASFVGNGRASRCALAFARRAAVAVMRSHRDLRLRAGIAGIPGLVHGDDSAQVDADRIVARARAGQLLASDRTRKISGVVHSWGAGPTLSPAGQDDAPLETCELPLPPQMIGRVAERLAIEQALAAADIGRGQQVLFFGEAGAGKSRLLDAVEVEARDRGFVVARARCGRSRAPLRFDALRQVLQHACLELLAVSGQSGEWHKALDGLQLTAHEKRKLRAIGAGEQVSDDVPPARRRVLLRAALHGFFANIAERRGLCLILDDIDRGDSSSLELFAELGARLSASRFVLAGAGRPHKGERVMPLAKRLVLAPIDEKDAAGIIGLVVGATPPQNVVTKIAAKAAGSPAQVVAFTRFLGAIGLLRVEGGTVTASLDFDAYPLPPTQAVLGVVQQALLAPATQRVLSACALIGQVVDPQEVAGVLPEVDVAEALGEALQHGVLVEERGAACFTSTSDLDALAARLAPDAARALHTAIADALERASTPPGQPVRADIEERLLFHRSAASDPERAAVHAERAADAWAQIGLLEATRDHYRRALQSRWRTLGGMQGDAGTGIDEERARAALSLAARATIAVSDVEPNAAVDLVLPMLRLVPDGMAVAARTEALRARGQVMLKLRRTDDALMLLDDALDRYGDKLEAGSCGSLLVDVALAMEQSGNPEGARAQLLEAKRKLESAPADQRGRLFDALLALGRLSLRARDIAAARELLGMALEDARTKKHAANLIDVLSALSSVEQAESKVDRALALLDDALTAAGGIGDGVAEARLKQQAARTLQQFGRIPDALHVARQALLSAQRVGWDEGAAVAGQLVQSLEARS